MTYNVRRCTGIDGRVSPERIAEIISANAPDLVALQEVDVNRKRTGFVNQPQRLAELTGMQSLFFARLTKGNEKYGIAVLSKLPLQIVKSAPLPTEDGSLPDNENTGAIWCEVRSGACTFQFIATHFGHSAKARLKNIRGLIGREWLGDVRCKPPIVLCGDMNTTHQSPVYAEVHSVLDDTQQLFGKYRKTWPSFYPVARIDHIFVSKGVGVRDILAPKNRNARLASDHLPLIADLLIHPQ